MSTSIAHPKWSCVCFFFRFFGHLSLLLQTVMQLQPSKVCQFEAHRYVRTSTATRMREAHRKACWLWLFFRLCGAYKFHLHWSGGAVGSWKSRSKTLGNLHLPVCIYLSLLLGTCHETLGGLSLLPLLRRMDVPRPRHKVCPVGGRWEV